jgi:2-polyprenyl-3-methyl-5-hydroxy-6-metoxy-1,4-benzoquinol methylase
MATVIMKWLETTPGAYDRGIRLLTLGRLYPLKQRIATEYIQTNGRSDVRVLEIGCGTGTLALMMAEKGAQVTAIDASPAMLTEARGKAAEAGVLESINFQHLNVTELGQHFEPASFDVIVSTLVFSELPTEVSQYVLLACSQLLKPGGRLLIADEMVPSATWKQLIYWAVRLPLVVLTWLLTRTSTAPLRDFSNALAQAGFVSRQVESLLGGSLQLIEARPEEAVEMVPPTAYPRLRHRITLKTLALDLLSLVNRVIPPYPKIRTGLYRVGNPDRDAPVLLTGNYELTVRRLVKTLDGQVDCWLVVANSQGINVWCAAGGGHFTASDVISGLKTSGILEMVDHRALILPQLCANGVDGWHVRQETGWGVHWGPVRARDIPAYLQNGRKKNQPMRQANFPLRDRLEMTTVMLFLYAFLLLIPVLIFWRPYIFLIYGLMISISYFYGIFLPWIPGRDGLGKGAVLALLTLVGLWAWSLGWGQLEPASLFGWSLGLGFLAFFVGAEFQGMSPLMRGEQANWSVEGLVGGATLLVYAAGRLLFGGGL